MSEINEKSSWEVMMNAVADGVMPGLCQSLGKALDQADEALFSTAAGSSKPEPFQNAIAEIRVGKNDLVKKFEKEVRADIPAWLEKKAKDKSQLSLIAEEDMSSSFGTAEMSGKFRAASHSWALLASVIGPTNTSKNPSEAPFQPDGLARALSRVSANISKNPDVRAVIEKTFERVIANSIHDVTNETQKVMEAHGWIRIKKQQERKVVEKDVFSEVASGLKGLKFNIGGKPAAKKDWSAASGGGSGGTKTESVENQQMYEPVPQNPKSGPKTSVSNRIPGTDYANYEPKSESWVGAISSALTSLFGIFKAEDDNNNFSSNDVDESAGNLVDLLSKRRVGPQKVLRTGASGNSGPRTEYVERDAEGVKIIPGDVIDDVLIESQKRLPAGIRACVHRSDRSLAQQIKYNIIRQAENIRPDISGGILDSMDDDAIDVVGMMFEVFVSERNLESNIKEEITRLSIPYIRLARNDRKLFMQRTHPARLLLNVLAEAAEGNSGENPVDLELLDRCKKAIDNVCLKFDGVPSVVFVEAEADIKAGLEEHKLKTSATEQKSVEIQMDKDKLEKAREMAIEAFDAHTVDWPAELKNAIGPYWQTHRVALLSREGTALEQSQSDGLLMMISVNRGNKVSVDDRDSYSYIIESMLNSNGISGAACKQVADSIWDAVADKSGSGGDDGLDFISDIEDLLGQLGGSKKEEEEQPVREARQVLEFSEDEKNSLRAYFEKMAVGTWLDFISPDGSLKAAKLSWISPISMKLMFVNRKGARMSVESINDLVSKVMSGDIKLRTDDPAFDRSLKQAISRLEKDLVN